MTRYVRTAVIVILGLAAVGTYSAQAWREAHAITDAQVSQIPDRLARIPLETTDPKFTGMPFRIEDRIIEKSGADYYAGIDYQSEDGGAVRLYVGAAVQTDGWLHEPTVCMPAHGWTTLETKRVPIWSGLERVPAHTEIWRMKLQMAGREMIVYYWLQWGDHIVTSKLQRAWRRFQSRLDGRRDGPVQIVILYASDLGGEVKTEARVASLVRALWPELSTVFSIGDD